MYGQIVRDRLGNFGLIVGWRQKGGRCTQLKRNTAFCGLLNSSSKVLNLPVLKHDLFRGQISDPGPFPLPSEDQFLAHQPHTNGDTAAFAAAVAARDKEGLPLKVSRAAAAFLVVVAASASFQGQRRRRRRRGRAKLALEAAAFFALNLEAQP